MSTNIFSETAAPRGDSGEARGLLVTLIGLVVLACRNHLKRKAASKPEVVTRATFDAQVLAMSQCLNANHLAILDKLDANHRELLAALERQATRINALESGLARVDERTRK